MEVKVKTIYVAPKLKRLVAYLIDIIPISFLVYSLFIGFTRYSVLFDEYLELGRSGSLSIESLNPAFIKYTNYINLIVIVIWGLYSAYSETTPWRGTFGKHLMKIKVGNVIGEPLDGETAFKRNVLKIIILSAFPFLALWVVFDKKNRGLYDVIANTLVVSDKDYSDR
ncbi:MAG: RDD family protein [Bacteroidota bacterium]